MAQFDVYRNPNPASRSRIPFLLEVQSDLLASLATRIVVPLCKPELLGGKGAERLNPELQVEGRTVLMLTPELAGVARASLGDPIANLSPARATIIAAIDMAIVGI